MKHRIGLFDGKKQEKEEHKWTIDQARVEWKESWKMVRWKEPREEQEKGDDDQGKDEKKTLKHQDICTEE